MRELPAEEQGYGSMVRHRSIDCLCFSHLVRKLALSTRPKEEPVVQTFHWTEQSINVIISEKAFVNLGHETGLRQEEIGGNIAILVRTFR